MGKTSFLLYEKQIHLDLTVHPDFLVKQTVQLKNIKSLVEQKPYVEGNSGVNNVDVF